MKCWCVGDGCTRRALQGCWLCHKCRDKNGGNPLKYSDGPPPAHMERYKPYKVIIG